jgi:hypothetical protein
LFGVTVIEDQMFEIAHIIQLINWKDDEEIASVGGELGR